MEEELRNWEEMRKAKATGLKAEAERLVAAYPDSFAPMRGLSLETCVGMVSGYRAAGNELLQMLADVWCQAEFGPQQISGNGGVTLPVGG